MKAENIARRWISLLLVCLITASVFAAGAFALSGMDPFLYADLSRAEFSFRYVPQANGEYALFLFSQDGGEVSGRAELLQDGKTIMSGEGFGKLFSVRLAADTEYTVRVRGKGSAVIEMARNTANRSYEKALDTDKNPIREKNISNAYDAHWYRFRAEESGRMLLSCVPKAEGLNLNAHLFDDTGALIARFETLAGGACMLIAGTQAGRDYYLRVSAPDGETGMYELRLDRSQADAIASALRFDAGEYSLSAGGTIFLSDYVMGEAMLWASDNPDIARVDQDGAVYGVAPGSANITAYGVNSRASCRVQVEYIELEGMDIIAEEITISEGDEASVEIEFFPEDASNRRVSFRLEDASIADITPNGVLHGKKAGSTILHASSGDGIADSVKITVTPAVRKYRALLVNEENYLYRQDSRREGASISARALQSLLESVEFENAAYITDLREDLSYGELIAAIRESFAGATEKDVSLFYIGSHGLYAGGMSMLELSDGSYISMRDIERELRKIPGTIVVIIDSCFSGGAIGQASDYAAFSKYVADTFAQAPVNGSKYKVICSAGMDQRSIRAAIQEDGNKAVFSTLFARALCRGAGWNIDRNRIGSMGADINMDGKISFGELTAYMQGRMDGYLDLINEKNGAMLRQDIQFYPAGDPLILIERSY